MNGLMKAYYWKPQFSEDCEKDFYNFLGMYKTLFKLFSVTQERSRAALSVMLTGNTISYYYLT